VRDELLKGTSENSSRTGKKERPYSTKKKASGRRKEYV